MNGLISCMAGWLVASLLSGSRDTHGQWPKTTKTTTRRPLRSFTLLLGQTTTFREFIILFIMLLLRSRLLLLATARRLSRLLVANQRANQATRPPLQWAFYFARISRILCTCGGTTKNNKLHFSKFIPRRWWWRRHYNNLDRVVVAASTARRRRHGGNNT